MKQRSITLLLTLFLLYAPSVMAHDGIIQNGCTEPGMTAGLNDGLIWPMLTDGIIMPMLTDGIILPWLINGTISPW